MLGLLELVLHNVILGLFELEVLVGDVEFAANDLELRQDGLTLRVARRDRFLDISGFLLDGFELVLVDRLVCRRQFDLGLVLIQPHGLTLEILPLAIVVCPDHPYDRDREGDARQRKDDVHLVDVVDEVDKATLVTVHQNYSKCETSGNG